MDQIIYYTIPTAEEGLLTFSVPPEYCANPTRIGELLEMTRGDPQSGVMQIEFGDKPDAIIRKRRGGCTGFTWDPEQEQHRTKGVIETVEYAPPRLLPGPWNGEISVWADGMAHRFLVAVIRPKGHPEGYRWELEKNPDPTDSGGIAEEDRIHRAVLRARFIGLMLDDTDEAGVVLDRGLGNLLPPRGLTIKDGNLFTDRENLVLLAQSNVNRTAGFNHLELMLTQAVLVTIPNLPEGVTTVCG